MKRITTQATPNAILVLVALALATCGCPDASTAPASDADPASDTATDTAPVSRAGEHPDAEHCINIVRLRQEQKPHPLDAQMESDARAELGPTTATAALYGEYTDHWDAELNRVYGYWMSLLPPEGQEVLRNAQRKWIAFRDAEEQLSIMCHLGNETPPHPGTMYLSFNAYRTMNLTRTRVLDLYALLGSWLELRDVNAELGRGE